MSKYSVTFTYIYEDCETVEVFAEDEQEAERVAEAEREGPQDAWNVPSLVSDEVAFIDELESEQTSV